MKSRDIRVPPAGEVIGEAFQMVHSHPVMLAVWLVLSLLLAAAVQLVAFSGFSRGMMMLCLLGLGLLYIFFHAGFMGSLDILLNLGGWSPAAVLGSGIFYFLRFFLISLFLLVLVTAPGVVLVTLVTLGRHYSFILPAVVMITALQVVTGFFFVFAYAGVVVEENGVLGAIAYSFRLVKANPVSTFLIVAALEGIPVLASFLLGRLKGGGLHFFLLGLRTVIGSYGNLLLMAGLVYAAERMKKLDSAGEERPEEETP